MKFIEAVKMWWKGASRGVHWGVIGGSGFLAVSLITVSVVLASTAVPAQGKQDAALIVASEIPTPSTTASSTPTPVATPVPSETEKAVEGKTSAQAPQVNDSPVAPVFDALTFAASQYGIGQSFDEGTSNTPFPTGIVFASAALPQAHGTEPITYSVAGLPVGVGFDTGSRTIFIDSATFFPANQETYNVTCHTFARVRMSVSVQYTATGPGGTATISVPLQFGQYTAGAGMFHFVC